MRSQVAQVGLKLDSQPKMRDTREPSMQQPVLCHQEEAQEGHWVIELPILLPAGVTDTSYQHLFSEENFYYEVL